jgi:hypothetical protein
VVADNIFTFKRELVGYVALVEENLSAFRSMTLPFGHGFELTFVEKAAEVGV